MLPKTSKHALKPSASTKFPKTKVASADAHMTNVNFCHEIDCKNILKGCLAYACRTYLSCGSTKLLAKDGWWGACWFVQLIFIPYGTWKYLPFNLVTSQVARPALIPFLYAHSSISSSRPTSCRSLIISFSPWWPGKQDTEVGNGVICWNRLSIFPLPIAAEAKLFWQLTVCSLGFWHTCKGSFLDSLQYCWDNSENITSLKGVCPIHFLPKGNIQKWR